MGYFVDDNLPFLFGSFDCTLPLLLRAKSRFGAPSVHAAAQNLDNNQKSDQLERFHSTPNGGESRHDRARDA
jgi:hypothetical protein